MTQTPIFGVYLPKYTPLFLIFVVIAKIFKLFGFLTR